MPLLAPPAQAPPIADVVARLGVTVHTGTAELATAAVLVLQTADSSGQVRIRVGASDQLDWPAQVGLLAAAVDDLQDRH